MLPDAGGFIQNAGPSSTQTYIEILRTSHVAEQVLAVLVIGLAAPIFCVETVGENRRRLG